ncbi:MAG: PQQ-binding-like beta-propeller repeat protein, partial [Acidobacteriota bacterium]
MEGRRSAAKAAAIAALAALSGAGFACIPTPGGNGGTGTSATGQPSADARPSDPSRADGAAPGGADPEANGQARPQEGRADPPDEADPFWRVATDGEAWATPTIRGGVAYVGSDDRRLYAIDVETGQSRFTAGPFPTPLRSTPAVDGERLVLIDQGGRIHAVALDGQTLWHLDVGAVGSAALDADGVFIVTDGGDLLRLRAEDGRELWRLSLGAKRPPEAGPQASSGRVVIATGDGELHGVDAASGDRRWRRSVGQGAALRLVGGTVYASGGGFLWALRGADGAERWRLGVSDFRAAPPAVRGDVVV